MPQQQGRSPIANAFVSLLLAVLIALVLLPQFTSPIVHAEQSSELKLSSAQNRLGHSRWVQRAMFQCGVGIASAVVVTFLGAGLGLYVPKLLTLWNLSKEVRAAVIAADTAETALTAAREAQLAQQMADVAVNVGADEAASTASQAQTQLQQAKDAQSNFRQIMRQKVQDAFDRNVGGNVLFGCVTLFSVPFTDRLAYKLFPDDPGSTPSSKELKPGSNTDSSQSLDTSDADIDQLFSQAPDQLCSDLGTTYDAPSDSCGGGDQATLSAYAQAANLISDTSLTDAGATPLATNGSTALDTSGQTSNVQGS